MHRSVVTFLVTVAICFSTTESAKVLLIVDPLYSHCVQFKQLGETLQKLGHQITAYVPDHKDGEKCFEKTKIGSIKYKVLDEGMFILQKMNFAQLSSMSNVLPCMQNFSRDACASALQDRGALGKIEKMKFDIAIVSTFVPNRCYVLIPHRYNIPFVSMSQIHFWFDNGSPFFPSIHSHVALGYPKNMTYFQRIVNFGVTLVTPFAMPWMLHNDAIREFAPELSFYGYISVIRESQLFIEDGDLLLEDSVPVMPNTILTGSFSTEPPKPLPADLLQFYQNAKKGVLLVIFGSIIDDLPETIRTSFNNVFYNTSLNVLWKNSEKSRGEKVKTSTWIPQSDALGHPKTLVFISHCGKKSFYEALYHAVPVICIPINGDQHVNADRAVYLGIGLNLDYKTLTTEKLNNAIFTLLNKASYKQNGKHWAAVYRDIHPKPAAETAAHAVDHVIKYGGAHLHPQSLDMPVISHLMLDIWLFIGFVCLVKIMLLCACCRCLCRCCRRGKSSKQKKE